MNTEFLITDEEVEVLNRVFTKLHLSAKAAGWHNKPRETGTDCALIHSEVSEAMEGFRKNLMDDHLPQLKMADVELADVVIRVADTSVKHGFNLGLSMQMKHLYNQTRPDHKLENREKEGGKSF